eukprot:scaffold4394_cov113-Isochrysis_galbana.AAC.7
MEGPVPAELAPAEATAVAPAAQTHRARTGTSCRTDSKNLLGSSGRARSCTAGCDAAQPQGYQRPFRPARVATRADLAPCVVPKMAE